MRVAWTTIVSILASFALAECPIQRMTNRESLYKLSVCAGGVLTKDSVAVLLVDTIAATILRQWASFINSGGDTAALTVSPYVALPSSDAQPPTISLAENQQASAYHLGSAIAFVSHPEVLTLAKQVTYGKLSTGPEPFDDCQVSWCVQETQFAPYQSLSLLMTARRCAVSPSRVYNIGGVDFPGAIGLFTL
ncbi:uncharacterized protein BT62DRAFT_999480 [Guyanagaster necrorhizus]|uniref:Uncharacterized protein n=1 Tax=Guyanagaster necrorhizus TaxID=856835 RepID=A0A9P7W5R5_9AGAR|nr:uncharacterized protein BT62DRAFT_999480 [Guyanagaster necrorhizus MCA 3950]KAG7451781.1 hypothetical protein BT62DRAFT_999480 [Guyanagaster necrorhizus MCA 3950]